MNNRNGLIIMGSVLISVLLAVLTIGCNKKPYMPDGPATYFGGGDGRYGNDNDNQNLLPSLKIMTYNIHAGVPPSKPDTTDLTAISNAIKSGDPDIVFLEEVDKGTNRNGYTGDQAKVIADSLKMNFIYFSARPYMRGFYGIAILSKYPLYQARKYLLPKENETTEQRVMGLVYVDLPGKDSVVAVVTHLQHNSATNRIKQMQEIETQLKPIKEKIVFGADLNELSTATNFFKVFDNVLTKTCNGAGCPLTFSAQKPSAVIDFLAYKPTNAFDVISHKVINERFASDHFPVIAELKFNR